MSSRSGFGTDAIEIAFFVRVGDLGMMDEDIVGILGLATITAKLTIIVGMTRRMRMRRNWYIRDDDDDDDIPVFGDIGECGNDNQWVGTPSGGRNNRFVTIIRAIFGFSRSTSSCLYCNVSRNTVRRASSSSILTGSLERSSSSSSGIILSTMVVAVVVTTLESSSDTWLESIVAFVPCAFLFVSVLSLSSLLLLLVLSRRRLSFSCDVVNCVVSWSIELIMIRSSSG